MKVTGCLALVALLVLTARAKTWSLVEGDSLGDAITAAKADYETTSEAQEIVLGAGTYVLTARQQIQLPLVIRGATGNPADVTIDGKQKIQLFQLDHAAAAILSVTLKGGYHAHGMAVRIEQIHDTTQPQQEEWRELYNGLGGTVSNCVVTGCKGYDKGYQSAVAVLSVKGLVTHCVITNNITSRQSDSDNDGPAYVYLARGAMRNTIIAKNSETPMSGDSRADKEGCAVRVDGTSRMVNCTIVGNSMFGDYTAIIQAGSSAKVVNTVIAGNTLRSVEDHTTLWRGTAGAFVNCATDGDAAINETCRVATLGEMKLLDVSGGDYHPLDGSVLLGAGTTDAAYDYGTTDFYGKPRFREATIDIGAAQYEAGMYVLTCSFTADDKLYAPRTPTYAVTKALGFGDTPIFYWDFDGDGVTDLVTTEVTVKPTLGAGSYATTLCVSNSVATFGVKYVFFDEPFVVMAQPVRYVKAGNPDAAEPYATEATAAADIQTAVDYCGTEEKVVVLKGTYNTTSEVTVGKRIEVIGATGNPEDVIIHNTANGCRSLNISAAGAFIASLACENGKYGGYGSAVYMTAGTVSNLVVRNSLMGAQKWGRGAALNASGSSFVTHCVITNNQSYAGAQDGVLISAVGLWLMQGARAENCLVAGNRTVQTSGDWYGWGQSAVIVEGGSSLRFSTVVGNRCNLSAVNVYGNASKVTACIVAGHGGCDAGMPNAARHATFSAFETEWLSSGNNVTSLRGSRAETEATYAETVASNMIYVAVDNAAHGLGETTVCTSKDRLIRKTAKKGWRLRKDSPAVDAVPRAAVSDAPATDLYGNRRRYGAAYDCGCHEAGCGFTLILR